MAKKLYIKTNGCQMNEYDSTKMAEVLLQSHGLVKTEHVEEADVILLNTCSIREKAQEKVFSQLGQWREYKAKNPHVVIGVGGCVASQEGEDIIKRAPFVDIVFGPQTLHRLPTLLNERMEKKNQLLISVSQKLKNLIICPHQELKDLRHLFRLWKAAANTAVFVLCLILAAQKLVVLLMMYLLSVINWRYKVSGKLIYWDKMLMITVV